MNRRLVLLNLLLLAAITAGASQLRQMWLASQARDRTLVARKVKPIPPAAAPAPAAPQPATAAAYLEVAKKMLFAKDRNPEVVIEVTPERPLPPLPRVHGVMNLGDGLTVIMSEKSGERHRGVKVGDKIGEYQLAAVEGDQLVFSWEQKVVKKRLDELISRRDEKAPESAAASSGANTGAPKPGGRVVPETVTAETPKAKPDAEPGKELAPGMAACIPGDDSPAGTEKGGMRKVVTKTPFGDACRWETAK
ncbi:MAG: hypothetical protein ACKV22_06585 [Bryobacteraceae bacterium]